MNEIAEQRRRLRESHQRVRGEVGGRVAAHAARSTVAHVRRLLRQGTDMNQEEREYVRTALLRRAL